MALGEIFGSRGLLARSFRGYEDRPQQREMAEAVDRTFREGGVLVVEAGPGTGKTFAYLIPALLSGRRVVVSTATKTLQDQIYYKDLPLLRELLSLDFRAVYMKGRENYLCLRRLQKALEQPTLEPLVDGALLREVAQWAGVTKTGDRAELDLPEELPLWREICSSRDHCHRSDCPYLKECFITRMRQEAAGASLIIVNHYLLFADLALRDVGAEVIPRYRLLVCDEAHHLEEVATRYFGLQVSNWRVEELVRDARGLLGKARVLEALAEASEAFFCSFRRGEERYRLKGLGDGASALRGLQRAMEGLRRSLRDAGPSEEALALLRRSAEIEEELEFIASGEDPHYVYWCEVRGRGVFLHASPILVAWDLRERLYPRLKALVLTSATLSTDGTFSYFRERLGLAEADELLLPPPFDWSRQAVLYVPRHLPEPNEPPFLPRAADEIEAVLRLTMGRAFVLFTSYRNMEGAWRMLKGRLPFKILLQGERPKAALLEEFKRDVRSVLFATGSFWEGVDVKGEVLSCVIIDRLPFDPPTEPVVEARCERIASQGGNPFLEYQLPMAILSLKQGMGRLIRSKEDRGVLCLLDNRVLKRGYGKAFLRSLPPAPVVDTLEGLREVLRRWDGGSVQEGDGPFPQAIP